MLSERERRVLARIERHLIESDPDLARLFACARPTHGTAPTFILVTGLALLVFGSLVTAVPVALVGIALALFALFVSHTSSTGFGRPSIA